MKGGEFLGQLSDCQLLTRKTVLHGFREYQNSSLTGTIVKRFCKVVPDTGT
jgi:hypothetical protein